MMLVFFLFMREFVVSSKFWMVSSMISISYGLPVKTIRSSMYKLVLKFAPAIESPWIPARIDLASGSMKIT